MSATSSSWRWKILRDGRCVVEIFGGRQIPWFGENNLTLDLGRATIVATQTCAIVIWGVTVAGDIKHCDFLDRVVLAQAGKLSLTRLRFLRFLNLLLVLVISNGRSVGSFHVFYGKLHRDGTGFPLLFESTTFLTLVISLFDISCHLFDLVLWLLFVLILILVIIDLLK